MPTASLRSGRHETLAQFLTFMETDARTVTIRDAVESDLGAIVRIYNAAIPGRMATADLEPVSVESRRDWFAEHDAASRPLWVAVGDCATWGWLSFQSFYGRAAYHATAEVSVYVAPEHQGQGVGRGLLAEAIDRAVKSAS